MNKKGFVMTETLVVTVFLVTIFTFIYVSIVPLIGLYEDAIAHEKDIDIVYKLYNIRKMILGDANKNDIVAEPLNNITCDSLSNTVYCNKMLEYLEISNYLLVYVDDLYNNRFDIETLNEEMYQYVKKHLNDQGKYFILLDLDKHTICHLLYDAHDDATYYAFGDPTTSSPTDYTLLDKHVFVGLTGDQKAVCIVKDDILHCFNNNNFFTERDHVVSVFDSGNCSPHYPTNIECSDLNELSFYCDIYSDGSVRCSEGTTSQYCRIDGNSNVECGT